jgi:cell division protein FtsL
MATLATLFRRPPASALAPSSAANTRPVPVEDLFRLRALPNEDIYLFCKNIDNTRVIRQSDPRSRGECWTFIGIACVLAALLTGLLAPGVANIFTGYHLQTLKQEEQRLRNERRVLDVDEAQLTSRERLQILAAGRDMQTPAPGQVVHLDPRGDGKLALNRH